MSQTEGRKTMGLHPLIQDCDNPYSRCWWDGWLIGVGCGVGLAVAVYAVSWWAGAWSVGVGL
jgi:hypothetical protein